MCASVRFIECVSVHTHSYTRTHIHRYMYTYTYNFACSTIPTHTYTRVLEAHNTLTTHAVVLMASSAIARSFESEDPFRVPVPAVRRGDDGSSSSIRNSPKRSGHPRNISSSSASARAAAAVASALAFST